MEKSDKMRSQSTRKAV